MRLASAAVAIAALVACADTPNRHATDTPGPSYEWCVYSRSADWAQFQEPDPDAKDIRAFIFMQTKDSDLLCPEIVDRCSYRWFRAKSDRIAFCQEIPGCSVSAVEFQKIEGAWKWVDGSIAISCL